MKRGKPHQIPSAQLGATPVAQATDVDAARNGADWLATKTLAASRAHCRSPQSKDVGGRHRGQGPVVYRSPRVRGFCATMAGPCCARMTPTCMQQARCPQLQ